MSKLRSPDPAFPLHDIYPKELKERSPKDLCTPMFIAALFTTAKRWKQPKCPSSGKLINNGMLFSLKKEENSDTYYNMDKL